MPKKFLKFLYLLVWPKILLLWFFLMLRFILVIRKTIPPAWRWLFLVPLYLLISLRLGHQWGCLLNNMLLWLLSIDRHLIILRKLLNWRILLNWLYWWISHSWLRRRLSVNYLLIISWLWVHYIFFENL